MCKKASSSGNDLHQIDVWESPPEPPREALVERKQTGCCEEAQADGVCCSHPRNTCETCGRSVLDLKQHVCEKKED
jgi:hypothetical protein